MTHFGMGLLGSVLVLGTAASAQAAPAPVYLDNGVMHYLANNGQTNVVTISLSGGRVVVKDTAGLTAGAGCKQTNSLTVNCDHPTGNFKVDLLDGNDVLTNSSDVTVVANGGPGNDVFNGSSAPEAFIGDDGDDVLNGNGGDDNLIGGAGNDTLNGGDGSDILSDMQGGNDVFSGGPGNDRLEDNGGTDVINGDGGDDTIFAFDEVKDTINCGSGTDSYSLDPQDVRTSCEQNLN